MNRPKVCTGKNGLKMSSHYISQGKWKYGGESYKLTKKKDAKMPQCVPEKKAAIIDALKFLR